MQTLAKTWSAQRYRKLRGFGGPVSAGRQEEGLEDGSPQNTTKIEASTQGAASLADDPTLTSPTQPGAETPMQSPKPTGMKMATPPPKVPLLRLQSPQGAAKGSPLQRVSDSQEAGVESAAGPSIEMTPAQQPAGSRPTSSHSSMSAEDADIFQRLADAEQHIVELRSRILGLTALNAELTKKLTDEVTETTALKALDARNTELQEQLSAANKEIAGLQADLALAEKLEKRMMSKVATAEKIREETEINLLNSGPIGRAQVERVAALNARIEELESQLSGRPQAPKVGTPPPRTPRIAVPHKDRDGNRGMIGSREDMQQQIRALEDELASLKQKLRTAEDRLSAQTEAAEAAKQSMAEEAGKRCVLQEQLAALNARLQEAPAAPPQQQIAQDGAAETGNEEFSKLLTENKRLASLLAEAEAAAEEAAQLHDMLEAEKESRALQEGILEDALARQRRAEQAAALALEQLEQERSAAAAARERSLNAAAGGLAEREEKAAIKAQLAGLQAEIASLRAAAKKAGQESEQRASELSSLQLQHSALRGTHEATLKELDAVHGSHTSAAKRAEEALAELALVRDTQQALTKQAQQLASVHAQQAAQARQELEEVRRAAADGIRSSGVSTEQLRELEHLRERLAAADQEKAAAELNRAKGGFSTTEGYGAELERLRLQLRHVEGELAAARGAAAGVDVNLAHVGDVIALKSRVAELMAELESEHHAAREVAALAAAKAEQVEDLSEQLALAKELLEKQGMPVANDPISPSSHSSDAGSRPTSPPDIGTLQPSSASYRLPPRFQAPQLEQLPRRSPRMVITPRQIEDRSEEILSLKTELAGLRDELRSMRGQLASAVSAAAAAEGRVRALSVQVQERDAALAQMREEHDAVVSRFKQVTAEAAQLRRNSVDQEVPGQELAALQAKFGAVAAKHEEALGKLAALQAAKDAADADKASALAEAASHQQTARSHAIRSEEKQAEIEELRAEVRRGEARLRTLHRDMKAQQDKAELHSKFSTQYLAELEDLRAKHQALQAQVAGQKGAHSNGNGPTLAASTAGSFADWAGQQDTEGSVALQLELARLREENAAVTGQLKRYEADVANLVALGTVGHANPKQKLQYNTQVKAELEEVRGSMAALLADKFALEQCVRYLAVKGGFLPPGASMEGAPGRSPLDTLQPPSLQEPYAPARDRPSTPEGKVTTPRMSGSPAALSPAASPASKREQRSAASAPAPDTEEGMEAHIMQRVATVCSWQAPSPAEQDAE